MPRRTEAGTAGFRCSATGAVVVVPNFMSILQGKTAAERAAIKAEGLAAIINTGTFTYGTRTITRQVLAGKSYTLSGVTVTLIGASSSGNVLVVYATAYDGNGPLPAADDNAYGFVNPPIMHRTSETEASESVIDTAKQWLYDAVVTYARNHGWNG